MNGIYALIAADPLLSVLLKAPSSARVRAWGDGYAPEEEIGSPAMYPYVVWQDISETPSQGLQNCITHSEQIIQFDVWARESEQAKQALAALQSLLLPFGYVTTLRPVSYLQDDTKLYGGGLDFHFIKT